MPDTVARRKTNTDASGEDAKPKRIVTDVAPETYDRLTAYIGRQTWKPSVADVLRVALERLLDDDEKK